MPESVITVVVGGFEPLMGYGVAHVLRADPCFEVLASDLQDATLEDAVARKLPRVAVLGEGVEYALLDRLKSRRTAPAVLVLLAQERRLPWTAPLAAGATCLASSISTEELIAAVHLAAQRRRTSPSGNGHPAKRVLPGETDLTDRQIEVLGYLRTDLKHAEIAHEMNLAEATVKTYSAQIRRKLGVRSRREL